MRKTLLAGMLLALTLGTSLAQDKFKITGKLRPAESEKMVVLDYVDNKGKNVKDSAIVTAGTFSLNGITAYGNKAYLSLVPQKKDTAKRRQPADYQEFYLEKGEYKVLGTDSIKNAQITGTQVQADFLAYRSQMDTLLRHYRALTNRFLKARSIKDTAEMKRIQAEGKPLGAKMNATLDAFILSHPDSYLTVDLLATEKAMVIDPQVFDPFYKPLSKRVLSGFSGQKLSARYEKAKQLSLGRTFDLIQPDDKGAEFKLSSLRGKYVLVDFWASWCAPCRAENPNLLKAYKELKDRNFEIVGVSLDESKAAWLKAVAADGMPWKQVSDLKGFKSDVAVKYAITAIPQNVLIDPKGVIIGKDLRGEDVNQKISALIK